MMASDFIVDVSEADFEYQVLAYSQQVPVVVDFWAEWCAPCKMLGPMLEKLAQEGQGSFRLAKVNVDDNPNLALRYAVHNIPAVKAFRESKMVAEFAGVQPEARLREFLRSIAPSPSDLELEKGLSLLTMQQSPEAEKAFRHVLQITPESTAALLGLAKSLLLQGKVQESHNILRKFPASREYSSAQKLLPLSQVLYAIEKGEILDSGQPMDPAFFNALRLQRKGNIEAAMDGLLDILREDKHYRDGEAQQIMVALLELLGENNSMARQYRSELASILF
jgi:putative thioredoxin